MKSMFRITSVFLTAILIASAFATPVVASRGNDRGNAQRQGQGHQKQLHIDAEVRFINDQIVLVAETRQGLVGIPIVLSDTISVDGQMVPLKKHADGFVVPTAGGAIVVPFDEFRVLVTNGEVLLVADVNPIITAALVALGVKLGAKYIPILAGVNPSATAKLVGSAVGGGAGAAVGAPLDILLITGLAGWR
ncbi:MAG: hypothetical protein KGZ64_00325 [Thermaerobacter sp.]|nr:hypothetical protein [Thermaerobacter sp.]